MVRRRVDLLSTSSQADGNPRIDLTFERALCGRHGEAFRAEWPSGYPTFLLHAWQKLDLLADAPEGLTLEHAIAWAMYELGERPMCCRFKREELLSLYEGCRKWKRRVCKRCHQIRTGSKLTVTRPDGTTRKLGHTCLRCLVYKMRPSNHASAEELKRFQDEEARG